MADEYDYRLFFDAKFEAADDGQLNVREAWSAEDWVASLKIPGTPSPDLAAWLTGGARDNATARPRCSKPLRNGLTCARVADHSAKCASSRTRVSFAGLTS